MRTEDLPDLCFRANFCCSNDCQCSEPCSEAWRGRSLDPVGRLERVLRLLWSGLTQPDSRLRKSPMLRVRHAVRAVQGPSGRLRQPDRSRGPGVCRCCVGNVVGVVSLWCPMWSRVQSTTKVLPYSEPSSLRRTNDLRGKTVLRKTGVSIRWEICYQWAT